MIKLEGVEFSPERLELSIHSANMPASTIKPLPSNRIQDTVEGWTRMMLIIGAAVVVFMLLTHQVQLPLTLYFGFGILTLGFSAALFSIQDRARRTSQIHAAQAERVLMDYDLNTSGEHGEKVS